jgi:hypothetical protein
MGGFSNYSKYDILRQLAPKFLPRTVLFQSAPTLELLKQQMQQEGISYPVILKPDQGERGWKVEKISNETQLISYLSDAPERLMLQEYIDLPEEYGIMYYRFPGHATGTISSVMKRQFLTVTGDGNSTLIELFQQNERCMYHIKRLTTKFKNELEMVLPADEEMILEEIGNHNRGTTFFSAQSLISSALVKVFDEASSTLNEFYFGRYDVRTHSFDEMLKGNFKVIEVNGANSEPTHIYDPDMSLWKAYRDLFHHWTILFRISMQNRKRGFIPPPAKDFYSAIRSHLKEKAQHPNKID